MDADRTGPNSAPRAEGAAHGSATVVPLVEEDVHVSTREVVTGRVRVRTVVETGEHLVQQDLHTEHVAVTRVPVGRYVDAAPAIRTEGEVTIVPVVEEVLVVETKLLLKEEVHIRRTLGREAVEHRVTLRKQSAVIEEQGSEPSS